MFVEQRWLNIFLLVFLFQNIQRVKGDDEAPEVVTSVGTIRGVRATNGNYSMFMGIPFATVNISNPFGPSLPVAPFNGVFEANNDALDCPQIEEINNTIIGSLDCLNLNIYVPDSASPENPLPVMFYIFGGRFMFGSHSLVILGPKFLVRHDVIMVATNSRVGPYGFMCLHTPEVPGNQGLRDQIEGLRWVREHIAAFGGDPNRITLFGSSSGAMSIDYHMLSEGELLFQGVILQSGTAFVQPLIGPDTNSAFRLAQTLGLNSTDLDEVVSYIATFDTDTVIQATEDAGLEFGPCIEKEIDGVERIISDNAVNLKAPKAAGMKVMAGSSDDEVLFAYAGLPPEVFPLLNDQIRTLLQSLFILDNESLEVAERTVRNFYIGDEDFTSAIMFEFADLLSDVTFIYPTERTIRQYLESGAEIFYYFFTYVGDRNLIMLRTDFEGRGAYHADELGYLFDISYLTDEPTPEDQLIIDRMTMLWTNFAKYGDPTPETTDLLPVKWEPITQGSVYHYLNITTEMNAGRRPFHQRMAFWDLFYQAYGQYERALGVYNSACAFSSYPVYLLVAIVAFMNRISP